MTSLPIIEIAQSGDPDRERSAIGIVRSGTRIAGRNSVSGNSGPTPTEDRATNKLRFPKGVVDREGTAPYCSGSCGGWLIIAEHNSQPHPKTARSYFFNPVSGARIALPPHSDPSFFVRDRRAGGKVFIKTVASSDPTDPNCIVAAIALHGYRVAFCRPNDASWTLQYPPNTPLRGGYGFTDLHFHEGESYATVRRMIDVVLMFDPLEVLSQSQSQGSYKGKLFGVSPLEGHIVLRWKNMRNPSFCLITSSSGEMLLVLKEERERENDREVLLLVFKGKVTKNVDKTIREGYLKYEVMNNIGEQAIFIGNIGAKTLMAMAKPTNSMPVIDKLGGHGSGNYIYFTNEKDDRIGVYTLVDDTLKYQLTEGLQRKRSKVWFTPKLS